MLAEVNLAYVFSFQIQYKFYYFVTETSHGNDVDSNVSNVHPQIDTTSSTDAECSDDDVQIGKFLFVCSDKLFFY